MENQSDNENPAASINPENPQSAAPATAETSQMPAKPASEPEDLVDIEYFSKIKLRIGRVIEAEALPKSKKLLKLKVDLGAELGTRQVLAGISQFYPAESLVGKKVVIVANLKPAKLMGYESQGMLLAGSNADNSIIKIIEPSEELPPGSTVR